MAFSCQIENFLGGTTTLNESRFDSINLIPADEMIRIISQITGHSGVVHTISSGFMTSARNGDIISVASGGTLTAGSLVLKLPSSGTQEPTDIYLSRWVIRYTHLVGGVQVAAMLDISGVFNTAADIVAALTTAGASNITLSSSFNNTPVITCVNTVTNTVRIIANTISSPPTLTIVDGDPPYLANVSTTEPITRGIGDMWFNPSTGELSVYTEDQ